MVIPHYIWPFSPCSSPAIHMQVGYWFIYLSYQKLNFSWSLFMKRILSGVHKVVTSSFTWTESSIHSVRVVYVIGADHMFSNEWNVHFEVTIRSTNFAHWTHHIIENKVKQLNSQHTVLNHMKSRVEIGGNPIGIWLHFPLCFHRCILTYLHL